MTSREGFRGDMQIEINQKEIDLIIKLIKESWLDGFEDTELESIYVKLGGGENDKS